MAAPYRLQAGDTGPIQSAPVSCGSACLTVARMLTDPVFAQWIRTGSPHLPGAPVGQSQAERFAGYEHVVMHRTNALFPGGRQLNLPWPRALGTPPWGAKQELERGAARPGASYAIEVIRVGDLAARTAAFDRLVRVVAEGQPGLLYIGDALLPRHVVLVLPGDGDRMLDVYDPGTGRVDHLRRDSVVRGQLRLSGWDLAWAAVVPNGARTVTARAPSRGLRSNPELSGA